MTTGPWHNCDSSGRRTAPSPDPGLAMGHAQCGLCCGTPPFFWTRCSDNSGGLSVETSTLHSDAHNGNSRRSSQAFPASSLEASRPSKVCNLGPQTSVHSSFHQRTLPSTRNKVGVFYSLAPPNQWTDGMLLYCTNI